MLTSIVLNACSFCIFLLLDLISRHILMLSLCLIQAHTVRRGQPKRYGHNLDQYSGINDFS